MLRKKDAPAYTLHWVTDQLAVGQAPMSYDQLDAIKEQGVTAILNLCAEFCDLHDIEANHGFDVYYLPIPDEEAPDMPAMEEALAWLDEAIYLGKKVLIHCRHGIGRTGTVLNAYLLRRGLGHKLAGKKLKGLKSQPASFNQWWTLRKYGRRAGKLTVREPSLEYKHLVDLSPFFGDYEALVQRAEDRVLDEEDESVPRCGMGHVRCCTRPIRLSFAEAVYLSHQMNVSLSSEKRQELIARAMETARTEATTTRGLESATDEWCLAESGAVCPLLEEEHCLLFDSRPLQCRTFELPEGAQEELWNNELEPVLGKLSQDIFLAFTGFFPDQSPPRLTLPDVVSGRYVQRFFKYLLEHQSR
ncbi:dual specificity protein phosphatase family protein [Oceanidesulfovibrio marinus]|uniref:Phosphatase n=1 Tax=Oceanidesulfovibrio marinus TaxID=370038 RepID=A0A6P1ZC81_9BACT|nr:dual specificity protein phosphatase family protein [Oceanidesulfovibrio marinus]QJT10465.1 phosphatase [Oceanidesulfovibrio marinus]TVM30331.1 phosphatase [Oceanidesulfovibrio marinus]